MSNYPKLHPQRFLRAVLIGAILAVAVFILTRAAGAMDRDAVVALGHAEFMNSCAVCHGEAGLGDGPMADQLAKTPSNLTRMKRDADGLFSHDYVYAVIDGRTEIQPHGTRTMPVWGDRFFAQAWVRASEVPHDVDEQLLVHGRISALTTYIESLQRPE